MKPVVVEPELTKCDKSRLVRRSRVADELVEIRDDEFGLGQVYRFVVGGWRARTCLAGRCVLVVALTIVVVLLVALAEDRAAAGMDARCGKYGTGFRVSCQLRVRETYGVRRQVRRSAYGTLEPT